MAFQQVPKTAKLVMTYSFDSEETNKFQNILYFHNGAGWSIPSLTLLATAALTSFGDTLDLRTPTDVDLDQIDAVDLDTEFGAHVVLTPGQAGVDASEGEPVNCSALMQFKGTPGQPPRSGWNFWPFLRTSETSANGQLTLAAADALEAMYEAHVAALEASVPGTEHVIVSRVANGVLRNPAVTSVVTSIDCRRTIGSQRDRRFGHN